MNHRTMMILLFLCMAGCSSTSVQRGIANFEPAKGVCNIITDQVGQRILSLVRDQTQLVSDDQQVPIFKSFRFTDSPFVLFSKSQNRFYAFGLSPRLAQQAGLIQENSGCFPVGYGEWPRFDSIFSNDFSNESQWTALDFTKIMSGKPGYLRNEVDVLSSMGSLVNPEVFEPESSGTIALARKLSFYVHEQSHMVQNKFHASHLKSGTQKEVDRIFNKYMFGEKEFCVSLKGDKNFEDALWQYWTGIYDLFFALAQVDAKEIKIRIAMVRASLVTIKTRYPREFNFLKNQEFIEGGAEYVGQKAAMGFEGYTFKEAVLYQLGIPVENEHTGNDFLYRTGALAGLLADQLRLKLAFNMPKF